MIEKKRVSYSLYVVLFILVMAAGLFLSGLFSFPDLTLFNVSEKLEYLLKHFWEIKRYFNDNTILCLGVAFILWFFICSYVMYHYRDFHMDIENGSEEWGDAADITKRRANENNEQNRFISKNLKIDTQGKGRQAVKQQHDYYCFFRKIQDNIGCSAEPFEVALLKQDVS